MRVKNNEIHVFEKEVKTEKSIYIAGLVIFILIFILLWIGMYELYKEIGSLISSIFLGSISSLILFIAFKGLSNGNFEEENKVKIIKGTRDYIPNIYLNNINLYNHNNYYKNKFLAQKLKTQLFRDILSYSLGSTSPVSVIYCLGVINFYPLLQKFGFMYINIFYLLLFIFFVYYFSSEYRKYKKTLKTGNAYILRRNIKNYYLSEKDTIFFY